MPAWDGVCAGYGWAGWGVINATHGVWAGLVATVTHAATVHVMNRYFSFWLKALFLPGFHGKRPESRK
jgi:hypothetical protein